MIEQPDILAERFAALTNPLDDSDWLDVRRRARTAPRRWLLIPIAAVVAVIVVGSAFALYRELVDFFSAERAPEPVVVQFGQMDARGSIGFGPRINAGEARKITEATIDGKRRILYVAPTPDGGFCWMWTTVGGSCGRTAVAPRPDPIAASWLSSPGGGPARLMGQILNPAITRVQLEYENGERTEIPFVWVSKPIDAGFFIFEVPAEHLQPVSAARRCSAWTMTAASSAASGFRSRIRAGRAARTGCRGSPTGHGSAPCSISATTGARGGHS